MFYTCILNIAIYIRLFPSKFVTFFLASKNYIISCLDITFWLVYLCLFFPQEGKIKKKPSSNTKECLSRKDNSLVLSRMKAALKKNNRTMLNFFHSLKHDLQIYRFICTLNTKLISSTRVCRFRASALWIIRQWIAHYTWVRSIILVYIWSYT